MDGAEPLRRRLAALPGRTLAFRHSMLERSAAGGRPSAMRSDALGGDRRGWSESEEGIQWAAVGAKSAAQLRLYSGAMG